LKARIVSSVRRTSGCTMIGSAGLSGAFAPVSARPCNAVLRVGDGVLIGDLDCASPWMATPSRASFIITNMAARPLFSRR
jgi:hypothetical protein